MKIIDNIFLRSSGIRPDYLFDQINFEAREHLSNWSLEILPSKPGLLGMTFFPDRKIELYLRPALSSEANAFILAHEIGHAVDNEFLGSESRNLWRRERNHPANLNWFDPEQPVICEDWAESFAMTFLKPNSYKAIQGLSNVPELSLRNRIIQKGIVRKAISEN